MMITTEQDALEFLLQQAADWWAKHNGAPETAPQLLAEFRERYETDPATRAEFDAGARAALAQAERYRSSPQYRDKLDELARLVASERARREVRTLGDMHAEPPTRH
jgi:hypothetical protein